MERKKKKLANSVLGGGGIKKHDAFTLIELLAIIVILAIIAVITVPIILNVIENSKKGAVQDSAYGYKDAINKYYVSELFDNNNLKLNGDYTITDKGELSDGTNTYEIPFSGNIPSGGNLTYENNVLKNGCITIDEYKVTIEDGEVTTTEKGECTSSVVSRFGGEVITDIPSTGHTGVEAIIYLDPENLSNECNAEKAAENVNGDGSKTGIKSGCMKWYAYKDDYENYIMILDHNTTKSVAWITKADYEQIGSQVTTPTDVGIEYDSENMVNGLPDVTAGSSGTNNRGPITLLAQLKADTEKWDESLKLTESDQYTAEWTGSNSYYNGNQKYTINYNGYKARLISAEEINIITGKLANSVSNIQSDYLDSDCSGRAGCAKGTNKYGWLFDYTGDVSNNCTKYGCNVGIYSDSCGYWTSSPYTDNYGNAWNIYYSGYLSRDSIDFTTYVGVRPVIKISKSKLSK